MARGREYFVYILTNNYNTLYIGVTNDLVRRLYEHRQKLASGFTSKYNLTKLLYYESTNDVGVALTREKELKKWRREKKVALILSANPEWQDLAEDW